ncbi:MAG: hypothetical protein KBE16_07735, partial [Alphaproteobacteria bacterium]|nr:hypothetical protein [Alphaproteobacteria bacterium]
MIHKELESEFIQSLQDQFSALNAKIDLLTLENFDDFDEDDDSFDQMILEADQLIKHLSLLQSPQLQKAFIPFLEETLFKLATLETAYIGVKDRLGNDILASNKNKMTDMVNV